jgi:hypothetical protein
MPLLPLAELIQVIRREPQLKMQIWEIIRCKDLEEAHKQALIQRMATAAQATLRLTFPENVQARLALKYPRDVTGEEACIVHEAARSLVFMRSLTFERTLFDSKLAHDAAPCGTTFEAPTDPDTRPRKWRCKQCGLWKLAPGHVCGTSCHPAEVVFPAIPSVTDQRKRKSTDDARSFLNTYATRRRLLKPPATRREERAQIDMALAASLEEGSTDECSICLQPVDISYTARRGAQAWGKTVCCRSVFHRQCMQRWLAKEGVEISPYVGHLSHRGHDFLKCGCPNCKFGSGDKTVTHYSIFV